MESREAIEWLKGCVVSYEVDNNGRPNGNVTCDLTQEVLDLAISALEKLEQDRWHPCSEKMPAEPFGCFATVMDTNPITQEEFENILPYFVGWDGEQWNDEDGERTPFEVIAWKPLPKPYKLEEDNEG